MERLENTCTIRTKCTAGTQVHLVHVLLGQRNYFVLKLELAKVRISTRKFKENENRKEFAVSANGFYGKALL